MKIFVPFLRARIDEMKTIYGSRWNTKKKRIKFKRYFVENWNSLNVRFNLKWMCVRHCAAKKKKGLHIIIIETVGCRRYDQYEIGEKWMLEIEIDSKSLLVASLQRHAKDSEKMQYFFFFFIFLLLLLFILCAIQNTLFECECMFTYTWTHFSLPLEAINLTSGNRRKWKRNRKKKKSYETKPKSQNSLTI